MSSDFGASAMIRPDFPYPSKPGADQPVWNAVKNHGVGRALVHGPADRMRAAMGRLRYLQKNPGMTRASFNDRMIDMLHAASPRHVC